MDTDVPRFDRRARGEEWMDDLSGEDERLVRALDELRVVNQWLGGYGSLQRALGGYLKARAGRTVRILDLGTGTADVPERLLRWADRQGYDVHVVGLDRHPATVAHARKVLDERLDPPLRSRLLIEEGDALALPYEDDAFDVAHAALFLHHLDDADAVRLLTEMNRVARDGLVVVDLHRHVLAYYGFLAVTALLRASPMLRHDGALSVLRAFRREELEALAEQAGLTGVRIHWRWAFRWVMSTLRTDLGPNSESGTMNLES